MVEVAGKGNISGINLRRQRGEELARLRLFVREKGAWLVPSSIGSKYYRTILTGKKFFCTCPDFELTAAKCKHVYAVEFQLKQKRPVGRPRKNKDVELPSRNRKTYRQNWRAYNEAQTNEKEVFQYLLSNLCDELDELKPGRGRPRLPISDVLFSVVFKVYSTVSGRRFQCDLEDAFGKGFIAQVPHFNSIFNYLENPELSEILSGLIRKSSLQLKEVEKDFAVDSTGFSSSRFTRWFDQKYGSVATQQDWVKCHLICGVKTNIVTSAEIHEERTHDAPILPSLVSATAKNFKIREVSGDKAYASHKNMNHVKKAGGTPFFAFKSNAKKGKGGLWDKMFHYFCFNRDEYLKHYHKRSNIESTVHMIKSKFGDSVRSKTDIAMKNEVLCKVLCHNICCLVSAMYELGIELNFEKRSDGARHEKVG